MQTVKHALSAGVQQQTVKYALSAGTQRQTVKHALSGGRQLNMHYLQAGPAPCEALFD